MWDSSSPLQLLKTMPKKLNKENLEKIQLIIDADKYKNSLISGFDLCGMYAPFCRGCKKTSIYPCAIAYINMLKSEGMEIEIDAKPIAVPKVAPEKQEEQKDVSATEQQDMQTHAETVSVKETVAEKTDINAETATEADNLNPPAEERVEQPVPAEVPPSSVIASEKAQVKRKIRIAVARKKI